MSTTFEALVRMAKPGLTLSYQSCAAGEIQERVGVIVELHQDGLVLDTKSGTEWVPVQNILSWKLPKQDAAAVECLKDSVSNPVVRADLLNNSQTTSSFHPDPVQNNPISEDKTLLQPAELELLFIGEPMVKFPDPNFIFPELSRDIQQDLTRWKNRYDYSQKVHEPARMSQDVPKIAELAETLESPELFLLAGLMANYSGLGSARAKAYFQTSLEIDQRLQASSVAIAAIAAKEKDWANVVKFLLWAARLEGTENKTNLVRCIGQSFLRLKASKPPLIGQLLEVKDSETTRRLAASLVALAVKEDVDAFRYALNADIDNLRQTKIGNDLFPWGGSSGSPVVARAKKDDTSVEVSIGSILRRGRVSAYYATKNIGFIVEYSTGQTWFFPRAEIKSSNLYQSLATGDVRQDVLFTGKVEIQSGKYPLAQEVDAAAEISPILTEASKRAPLKVRLQAIPRDGSAFARAMEAEQLDQLSRAEELYREEVSRRGQHVKSAVKNLAALQNRKGDPQAAIKTLDEYENMFVQVERASLDQMRVQFYVKAQRFNDAAKLLVKLAKNTLDPMKRLAYKRQEAYCYIASGDFDKSIEKLNLLVRANPSDDASIFLLEKAKDAKQTGLIPSHVSSSKNEEEYEDVLSSLALGLSSIAQHHLDQCEQRGIDAPTRESRVYTDKDSKQIYNLLESVKGRRPRERADYLLTLAWLCEHASSAMGNQSVHEYLRRYFVDLAEATFNDGSPKDVVRCYAVESLVLCPVKLSRGSEEYIEMAFTLLLGTYIDSYVEPSVLLLPEPGERLPKVVKFLDGSQSAWNEFTDDSGFYYLRAPVALNHLKSKLKGHPIFSNISTPNVECKEIFKRVESSFVVLPKDGFSADRLYQMRSSLVEIVPFLPFELDRVRIADLIKILNDTADYALERHFRERETRYLRLNVEIDRLVFELQSHPTHLTFEKVVPFLRALSDKIKVDFDRIQALKPELEIRNVLDNDFYVLNCGHVALRLLISSQDESTPPVEAIGLLIEQGEGEPCHSPEPLHGGQTREIELSIKPTDKQIRDGVFTVSIRAEYRTRQGRTEQSQLFPLAVRLGEPSFEEIPNPYSRYAGGSPVEDKCMFFGRAALIDRVVNHVTTGSAGQCFVLYGQKRSGKSSVLKQVENRLDGCVLYVPLSAGTFSPSELWTSFARLLLQELSFRLEDRGLCIPANWPSRTDITSAPLESIRHVSRLLLKQGQSLVIAIDEFTYIYENAKDDILAFMRGWKALLEARTFNALLVGQDTMPRFKQDFPNEFGMTHDERITYLSIDEAESLATEPILLNGSSRFRGQALHRLFSLTAGSPFFLQIACDRLVRHLNVRKAVFVTEADIDQIARSLTVGSDCLPPERFDALVTAAGEKVAVIPRVVLWNILSRIARESLHSGWCYRTALSELQLNQEAVKDLVDREVLAVEGDRVKIRVGLFAAWLRANQ